MAVLGWLVLTASVSVLDTAVAAADRALQTSNSENSQAQSNRRPGAVPARPLAAGKPVFPGDKLVHKLANPCSEYFLAGSGRYLLFRDSVADRIDAFDVLSGKIAHQIRNVSADALIAAGAEKLLVVLPGQKLVQRYSLHTFEREQVAPFRGEGVPRIALLGAGGDGPLLVAGDDAQLIDVGSLSVLNFDRAPIGRHGRYGFVGRVSYDGQTFTGIPANIGPVSYQVMRVVDDSLVLSTFGGTSHAVRWAEPTADGSLFLVPGGLYSARLDPLPARKLKDCRLSATLDPRYFTATRLTTDAADREMVELLICTVADRRVVHTETGFEELALQGNTRSRMSIANHFLHDGRPHLHYLPWANVIATIGYDGMTVTLRRFNLIEKLRQKNAGYLFVDSVPPSRIKAGHRLNYRVRVRAARGGVAFKLEAGPEGMTVSKRGSVKWKPPRDFSADTAVVAVGIRDRSGNEILHTFEVTVE